MGTWLRHSSYSGNAKPETVDVITIRPESPWYQCLYPLASACELGGLFTGVQEPLTSSYPDIWYLVPDHHGSIFVLDPNFWHWFSLWIWTFKPAYPDCRPLRTSSQRTASGSVYMAGTDHMSFALHNIIYIFASNISCLFICRVFPFSVWFGWSVLFMEAPRKSNVTYHFFHTKIGPLR